MKPYTIEPTTPQPRTRKRKENDSSTTIKYYLTKSSRWEDFLAKETLMQNPGREEWRQRLISTMLKEAAESDILEVMEFCLAYKINERKMRAWSEDYPDIKEAYEHMKLILASKRRIGCMRKKLDSYSSFRDIHLLDKTDDEVNRYHMDLKKLQDLEDQVKYLVEMVRPKTITAQEMQEQRENNE